MKKTIGAAAILTSAVALSACGTYYEPTYTAYDYPYYRTTYDDCYGSYRAAYCSYPRFSGTVVIAGDSYRGLRYRDGPYGREYWFDGRWIRA